MDSNNKQPQVFISYSHADDIWLQRLLVHLSPLRRDHQIESWSDRRLIPGTKWRDDIKSALERSSIAVLLVSADFLASEFIRTHELPPLLQSAELRGALILPVIASPCLFHRTPELAQFQAVNDPATPIDGMSKSAQEAVFARVAETILDRVASLHPKAVERNADAKVAERFTEESTWAGLVKIGDWIHDEQAHLILGQGMRAYLLSQEEYGDQPFSVDATLEFSNFQPPRDGKLGMNAGIILGWNYNRQEPRYLNVLLTGDTIEVERCGFEGGPVTRDYKRIAAPKPFKIQPDQEIHLRVEVDTTKLVISSGNKKLIGVARPEGLNGRVGIRPWRSMVRCSRFDLQTRAP